MRISIIIPALNEAAELPSTLASTSSDLPSEVIVVDGGSRDETARVARSCGARILCSDPGRAKQMNLGAAAAAGDVLLFLHADTRLPAGYHSQIHAALARPGTAAGAFRLRIRGSGRGLRFVEHMANWRSRYLQMPYGDQAVFVDSERFHRMGGYRDIPIMEDYELVVRLQKQGRIVITAASVETSSRRWDRLGVWRTTWRNQRIVLGYALGIPPARLAAWYAR